jgi:hypothetical protein
MLKDKLTENQEVSVEPMQQSFQFLQDPISNVLDDLCCQSHFPSSSYGMKSCYDIDMVRQPASLSFSAEVSLHSPSEHLQPYHEFFEDLDNINIVLDHVVDLAEFKKQGAGQFFLDPIATYMEKFFTTEPQSISGITFGLQDCRGLCCKYQDAKQFMMPMQVLFLILFENIKRA